MELSWEELPTITGFAGKNHEGSRIQYEILLSHISGSSECRSHTGLGFFRTASEAGNQGFGCWIDRRLRLRQRSARRENTVGDRPKRHSLTMRTAGFNHVDLAAARDLDLTLLRIPADSP